MKIKKKNLAIGIAVIVLIAAVGTAYGLSKSGSKADEPKKIEGAAKKEDKKKVKTEGVKAGKVVDKKTDTKSDVKAENEKKDDSTEKTAKSENKGSKTSSSAKGSSPSASTPSHSSSSGSAPASKPKRWVVDQPAWDETVQEPVYSYRPTWWGTLRDGSMKIFYSEEEVYNAYGDTVVAWGNGQDEQYISGYTTKIIHHDEVGHWE